MDTTRYWFDERGHLAPYEIIEFSFDEFEKVFVSEMEDKEHRKVLFQAYKRFLHDFTSKVGSEFFQYVDGSFTTKKLKPGDIDLVVFIDIRLFNRNKSQVIWFLNNCKKAYGLDIFFVPVCKPFERNYTDYLNGLSYWNNLFGNSQPDENLRQHRKGIVKIHFRHERQQFQGIS